MKFIRKLSLALVATLVLASNAFGVTSTLSKGKEINQFAELAQAKVKEREHKLAQEYANAYADNYADMDAAEQQEALNQTKSFIEKAIKECKQSRIELVTDSIQAQLLGEIEEIVGDAAYQGLAKTLENAVQQKRATMTSEDAFKLLAECSAFFTADQPTDKQEPMIPKLRLLIEHGAPLIKKEMDEENFDEQFLEPVDLILQKIADEEIYKDLSAKLEFFMPEAPEIVEEKPSIAAKLLAGIMLMSIAVGGYNLLVKIQDPTMHPPSKSTPSVADADISVEAVDLTEALEGKGDVTEIKVEDITPSSESQDFATAVEEVVQVAEAEQATPDMVKIDAINRMQQGTMNTTPAELAQNQVAAPQPSFFQSIRNLFTGYSSSFYDPVQHSGFDIKKVAETNQAASVHRSQMLEAAKTQQYEQQRINELTAKVARDNAPSTIIKAWNSLISIFEEHTQATIKTLEKLLTQDIENTNKIEAKLNETSSDAPEVIALKKELNESKNKEEVSRKEIAALKKQLEEEKLLKKQTEQRESESQEKHKEEISQLNQQIDQTHKKIHPTIRKIVEESVPLRPEYKGMVARATDVTGNADGSLNVTIRTRSKWDPFGVWANETLKIMLSEEVTAAHEDLVFRGVVKGAHAHDLTSKPLAILNSWIAVIQGAIESAGPTAIANLQTGIILAAGIAGAERTSVSHNLAVLSLVFNIARIGVPIAQPIVQDLTTGAVEYLNAPSVPTNE